MSLTNDEITAIKIGAIEAMNVKKSRRAEVMRVLNYAMFLVKHGLTPDKVKVMPINSVEPTEPPVHEKPVVSPFLHEKDHKLHLVKQARR